MTAAVSHSRIDESDIRLWMMAFGMSLVINALIVLALAFWIIDSLLIASRMPDLAPSEPEERIATIMPQWEPVPEKSDPSPEKQFTRTSPDQAVPEPPKQAAFEGERNTQATSDTTPVIDAPELPSQQGIDPLNPRHFETTESRYKDGVLDQPDTPDTAATEVPPAVAPEIPPAPAEPLAAIPPEPAFVPPLKEKAFEGPKPVEVAAQNEVEVPEEKPEKKPVEETPPKPHVETTKAQEAVQQTPKPPAKIDDPAFAGFQQKTAIVGSISRTGKSSLDVEDSPIGRYQAQISRAVELEWQRNCVRHRDFITPGFLTVRFFVESSGKVRSVQFVGDMQTGEVQKGFTLNSIRDAPIPKMPDTVRKEQDGEPLELMFRFYF